MKIRHKIMKQLQSNKLTTQIQRILITMFHQRTVHNQLILKMTIKLVLKIKTVQLKLDNKMMLLQILTLTLSMMLMLKLTTKLKIIRLIKHNKIKPIMTQQLKMKRLMLVTYKHKIQMKHQ